MLSRETAIATSQAELDTYIQGTLAPALAALETTGQSVAAAVEKLIADYQGGAEDLTPQLTELQTLVGKLTADASSGAALATQITSADPGTPAPVPATDAKPAT